MKNLTTNQIMVGIAVLFIGFGIGYAVADNKTPEMGNHTMGNGMMMSDNSMMGSHSMQGNSMQSMMDGMMNNLRGKTGDAFDQAFLSEMIMHHEGAVDMAEAVLATSKRPELRTLANDIISAQTKEINMMKKWQREWSNR